MRVPRDARAGAAVGAGTSHGLASPLRHQLRLNLGEGMPAASRLIGLTGLIPFLISAGELNTSAPSTRFHGPVVAASIFTALVTPVDSHAFHCLPFSASVAAASVAQI
jgi:hypothetical protein